MNKLTTAISLALPVLGAFAIQASAPSAASAQTAECQVTGDFEDSINTQTAPGCENLFAVSQGTNEGTSAAQISVNLFVGSFAAVNTFREDNSRVLTCSAADATPDGDADESVGDCSQAAVQVLTVGRGD